MTEEEREECYCGRWEERMRFLEKCVEWMGRVDTMDMPYSSWKEPYLFAHRNVAMFCILQEVRKLSNHALKEARKMREEFLPPQLTSIKHLQARLDAIATEKLEEKALKRYEKGNEGDATTVPYSQGDVDAVEEARITEAAKLIGKVDVRYLSRRIFSELRALSSDLENEIDYDEPDATGKAYRNFLKRKNFEFKRKYDDLKVEYIFSNNLNCTVNELSSRQQKEILQSMEADCEGRLMRDPKHGGSYRQNKAHGWGWNMLVDQFYHADEARGFAEDMAMLTVIHEEMAEVNSELFLEEIVVKSEESEVQELTTKGNSVPAEDSCHDEGESLGVCQSSDNAGSAGDDAGKTNFERKLESAYQAIDSSKAIEVCILMAALCAHGEFGDSRNTALGYVVKNLDDFMDLLQTNAGYSMTNKKSIQNNISNWGGAEKVLRLDSREALTKWIKSNYTKPDGTKAARSVMLAEKIFDLLDDLSRE